MTIFVGGFRVLRVSCLFVDFF